MITKYTTRATTRGLTRFTSGIAPGTPLDLSIIPKEFWYDATDASTISDTGGLVDSWADKSGNGRHLVGTTTTRPVTGTRTIGGLNGLDFDGTDDYLQNSADFQAFNGGKYCLFAVCQPDTLGDNYLMGTDKSVTSEGLHIGFRSSTEFTIAHYFDDGNISYSHTTNAQIIACEYTDPGGELFIDGDSKGTSASPAGDLAVTTGAQLNIGSGYSETNNNFNGIICELIGISGAICNEDTRLFIEGVLAWKYGLQGNLPASHRYKNGRPVA